MESIDVTNVGIAQTAAQVREALPAAMALSAARQVEARTFIATNGHTSMTRLNTSRFIAALTLL